MNLKKWGKNILIGVDQLANTLTGGDPDETISSRIGKNPDRNWFTRLLYRFLDWIQPKHCEESIEADEGKDAVLK